MDGTKIDAAAVQAELQGISALMNEINRVMGPDTWQGGTAAAFTTDLDGHGRSLGRMMAEILRAVARANEVPMTLTPPHISRVTPPSGLPGVASVSISRMERLETALRRAADGLPDQGRRIRALLAKAGPGIAGTAQCDRTAAWCSQQAGRMRTRLRYAIAENRGRASWGMTSIPDKERLDSKEMARLGQMQADLYAAHMRQSNAESTELLADIARSLRENRKDAGYLAAFFSQVPPGSIGKLAYNLHRRHGGTGLNATDKQIVADMGTALAAASNKEDSEKAVSNALGPIGSDMPGQALLVKLSAPEVKWSSAVLLDMAKAALRWRQRYPSYELTDATGLPGSRQVSVINQPHGRWWDDWGIDGSGENPFTDPNVKRLREYDPALNILGRIAQQQDTTAARELAATKLEGSFTIKDADKALPLILLSRGSGNTYGSLLVAPDWMDQGTAAGAVIKLATTPEKGHEEQAAENAANIMETVAWWNDVGRDKVHKFLDRGKAADYNPLVADSSAPDWMPHRGEEYFAELGPGLRQGLLQMTRMHIPALATAERTTSGTGLFLTDPVTGQIYIHLGQEVQSFLRTLAIDDRAWAQLALDTQRYRQLLNAWAIRKGSLGDATTRGGYLEGNLIAAYAKERVTNEERIKAQYEEVKKQLSLLRDAAAAIIGVTPAGNIGADSGVEMATNPALDKIKYADFDKNVEQIKAVHSSYSSQLYVDLARGYAIAHNGKVGDPFIDGVLWKSVLSDEERDRIVVWAMQHEFSGGSSRSADLPRTGLALVRETQDAVSHNAPQQ
ncbi:hypothetical protein Acsp04_50170 [Actinomadura sp. NBRC 104425]|uniref:hypothetical protein n=1 Tax=Actinomadura sp. NBRC 104425 TaxID=3032204 RepID=UPI0024A1156C|nr:hypothetical protein [Actinomadura sp. NBRC 104425]GLZ14782.1 hypothetical protein Acsp04_50170 [Actinomadura sp. NBRC 104425]